MKRITDMGGLFLANDPEKLSECYRAHLGIETELDSRGQV
jgi:hypothetical protein